MLKHTCTVVRSWQIVVTAGNNAYSGQRPLLPALNTFATLAAGRTDVGGAGELNSTRSSMQPWNPGAGANAGLTCPIESSAAHDTEPVGGAKSNAADAAPSTYQWPAPVVPARSTDTARCVHDPAGNVGPGTIW